MIVAACLNPALDITYRVAALVPGEMHRVSEVIVRAGGKGTNVANVLCQLGAPVVLLGPVGGATGAAFAAELRETAIEPALIPIEGETRRTVTVTAGSSATVFNEAGPIVTAGEWAAVLARFEQTVSAGDVVVLSGSLPPGLPVAAYRELVERSVGVGARVLLDADGPALTAALTACPTLVKINLAEAAAAIGREQTLAEPFSTAAALRDGGATGVILTLGGDGLAAVVDGRRISAALPAAVQGNPTGAGDALAAAVAQAMSVGIDWPQALVNAVAVSAAAVAVPYAGGYDADLADRLRSRVIVREF